MLTFSTFISETITRETCDTPSVKYISYMKYIYGDIRGLFRNGEITDVNMLINWKTRSYRVTPGESPHPG